MSEMFCPDSAWQPEKDVRVMTQGDTMSAIEDKPGDFQWGTIDGWISAGKEEWAKHYAQSMANSTGMGYRELYSSETVSALKAEIVRLQRELAEARGVLEPSKPSRIQVPLGQTPLDANLHHPLLDVIRAGSKSRDDGSQSPYHGHSLEHCLHAIGWVERDLRLALDAMLAARTFSDKLGRQAHD